MWAHLGKEWKRRCTYCKEVFVLSLDNFYASKSSPLWFKYECRCCYKVKAKRWREENPEMYRAIWTRGELKNKTNIEKRLKKCSIHKWLVYVLSCNGFYKIWVTKQLDRESVLRRICNMQTWNPYLIELLKCWDSDDVYLDESKLHNKFKEKRIRWERFSLSEKDILSIQ